RPHPYPALASARTRPRDHRRQSHVGRRDEDRVDRHVHTDAAGADAARPTALSCRAAPFAPLRGCNRGACLGGVRSKEAPTVRFSTDLTLSQASPRLWWRSLGGATTWSR